MLSKLLHHDFKNTAQTITVTVTQFRAHKDVSSSPFTVPSWESTPSTLYVNWYKVSTQTIYATHITVGSNALLTNKNYDLRTQLHFVKPNIYQKNQSAKKVIPRFGRAAAIQIKCELYLQFTRLQAVFLLSFESLIINVSFLTFFSPFKQKL